MAASSTREQRLAVPETADEAVYVDSLPRPAAGRIE
jgi:hypothetical protein